MKITHRKHAWRACLLLSALLMAGSCAGPIERPPATQDRLSPLLTTGDYSIDLRLSQDRASLSEDPFPAIVKVLGNEITIDSKGKNGNAVHITGSIAKGVIDMSAFDIQGGQVVTIHFTGTVKSASFASGDFVGSKGGDPGPTGVWVLERIDD
jgi:hypothetical protein